MKRIASAVTAAALGVLTVVASTGCANRDGSAAEAADKYPSKDITLVVPYAAGGASDLAARTLASEMEKAIDGSIIVENRTGGTGSVGLGYLAGRPADGYTIGYVPVEVTMLGHTGFEVDPADYDVLGQIVNIPAVVSVPTNSKFQTLDDLIQAAKEQPGQVSVGNNGPNGIWHASTLALGEAGKVQLNPIPFDGGAPAVAAVISGKIDAVVSGASEVAQAHKDGQLRALAVLTPERVESLKDVSTAAELGYDIDMAAWGAIGAPAGLPDEVASKLAGAVETAVKSENYQQVITKAGNQPRHQSQELMVSFVSEQHKFFGELLGK